MYAGESITYSIPTKSSARLDALLHYYALSAVLDAHYIAEDDGWSTFKTTSLPAIRISSFGTLLQIECLSCANHPIWQSLLEYPQQAGNELPIHQNPFLLSHSTSPF